MNRRQWLGYVAATVPLLCLSVPVVGATPAQEGHPHDALLHRLGCADAKQQQVRFVSVQHRKLVDADFEQPAPFYDRVLTFWEDACGNVWVIMDYTGKDEKLREHFKRCFTSETFVFAVFERRDNPSFYFWVGATTEVPTLELLFSKLAALEYLLIDRGGVVDIRGLGNCGVEFTPTRLPCECAIVRVHVRGAPECSLCDKSWAAHIRAPVQQFAC